MKEIRIIAQIKNNLLLNEMEKKGIYTLKELSRRAGVYPSTTSLLVGLKKNAPFCKNGEYRRSAKRIAEFFKVLPEDLFPKKIYGIKETRGYVNVNYDKFLAIEGGQSLQEELEKKMLKSALKKALLLLPDRTRRVLKERSEGRTLREIGEMIGVNKEGVRQIEAKGLRVLSENRTLKNQAEMFYGGIK